MLESTQCQNAFKDSIKRFDGRNISDEISVGSVKVFGHLQFRRH